MSRRAVVAIGAALSVVVAVIIWLGAPESHDVPAPAATAARLDAAVVGETTSEWEPEPLLDAPILPLVQPLADGTSPGTGSEPPAGSEAASGRVQIIVTVRVDGQPLEEALRQVLQPGLFGSNPACAIATHDPVGPEIDTSVPYAARFLTIGEFSTLRDWFDHEPKPGRRPGCFGVLEVPDEFPLHVSVLIGSVVIATESLNAPREELVFEMTSAQLDAVMGGVTLRVTSAETGQPIGEGQLEYGLTNAVSAKADPTTGLVVEPMAPGLVTLTVLAPGYEKTSIATRVPSGRSIDLGDFALHKARRVAGTVLQPDGQPASTAFVWLVPLKSKLDALSLFEFESSVQDGGRFELSQAGPRQYLLVATDFSNAAVVPVDMRRGDLTDLELRMQPLTLLELSLPPEPLAAVRLRIWTKSGVPVSSWPDVTADRTSTEWTVPLVPGDYVLAINSIRRGQTTKVISVGAAGTRFDLAELLK